MLQPLTLRQPWHPSIQLKLLNGNTKIRRRPCQYKTAQRSCVTFWSYAPYEAIYSAFFQDLPAIFKKIFSCGAAKKQRESYAGSQADVAF
jgi:hypothetical protein